MTEHIMHRFDEELSQLHRQVESMAGLVLDQTQAAIACGVTGDTASANEFADREQRIDGHELAIDKATVFLLARRGPVALDLRTVMAISKMTTDLERIGDEALALYELAGQWQAEGSLLDEFREESDAVLQLLQRTLVMLETFDVMMAEEIVRDQTQLTEPFRIILNRFAALEQHPSAGSAVLRALALRCIERIGDHACNLCEQVVYLGRGIDVRHQ